MLPRAGAEFPHCSGVPRCLIFESFVACVLDIEFTFQQGWRKKKKKTHRIIFREFRCFCFVLFFNPTDPHWEVRKFMRKFMQPSYGAGFWETQICVRDSPAVRIVTPIPKTSSSSFWHTSAPLDFTVYGYRSGTIYDRAFRWYPDDTEFPFESSSCRGSFFVLLENWTRTFYPDLCKAAFVTMSAVWSAAQIKKKIERSWIENIAEGVGDVFASGDSFWVGCGCWGIAWDPMWSQCRFSLKNPNLIALYSHRSPLTFF